MSITTDEDPIFTLTTGPVDAYPEVLRGLARPVLYDYDPVFLGFYERVEEKLRSMRGGLRKQKGRYCGTRTASRGQATASGHHGARLSIAPSLATLISISTTCAARL